MTRQLIPALGQKPYTIGRDDYDAPVECECEYKFGTGDLVYISPWGDEICERCHKKWADGEAEEAARLADNKAHDREWEEQKRRAA